MQQLACENENEHEENKQSKNNPQFYETLTSQANILFIFMIVWTAVLFTVSGLSLMPECRAKGLSTQVEFE